MRAVASESGLFLEHRRNSPAVSKDAFYFLLVSPAPGGHGGGSGLPLSSGKRGLGADAGPDPGRNLFRIFILALSAAGIRGPTEPQRHAARVLLELVSGPSGTGPPRSVGQVGPTL